MTTSRLLSAWLSALLLLCISTLSAQTPKANAAKPAEESLASRIQRLADIEEIRTLLIDYGRFLDSRDLAAYSRLFASDGEWTGGFGSVKGVAAIQKFMEKNVGTAPNTANTYHLLSNFRIDVHGSTATAWSRWSYVTPSATHRPVLSESGRYEDTLVREAGKWKFKRRVVSNDLPRLEEEPIPAAPKSGK